MNNNQLEIIQDTSIQIYNIMVDKAKESGFMLADLKLEPLEMLSAIDNLKKVGGQNFNKNLIEVGKNLYQGKTTGTWNPFKLIKGKDVLIIGSGPGSLKHSKAIENFITKNKLFVIGIDNIYFLMVSIFLIVLFCLYY